MALLGNRPSVGFRQEKQTFSEREGSSVPEPIRTFPDPFSRPMVPSFRLCPAFSVLVPAIVQLTLSLYMVMLGLGQIIFWPTSDRIGRRPVLIGGAILFAATSFNLATSSAAIPFIALRFLQAFGPAAVMVATFAAVRDVYAHRSESVVISSLLTMPYSRRKPARRGVRVARPSSSIGRIRPSTSALGSP